MSASHLTSASNTPAQAPIRILCIGDSITKGGGFPGGYRRPLQAHLRDVPHGLYELEVSTVDGTHMAAESIPSLNPHSNPNSQRHTGACVRSRDGHASPGRRFSPSPLPARRPTRRRVGL